VSAKRILDVVTAAAGLVLLSPLLLVISLLVLADVGRPVFFRQRRPGLNGEPFELIKFRTMRDDPEAGTGLEADGRRLTRFGRRLRAASLDELPELWNVLRGEMSLVGPRPLLMQYLDRYTPEQARRHLVKPGLTGWAQVKGRNAISWDEKFACDNWYVDNRSMALDLKILLMTAWQVIRGTGISAEGEATMPEYMGPSDGPPGPRR
jgi:lipopolysaccharide/colanic/teichoic acid biosynthesis glycosyltransferase